MQKPPGATTSLVNLVLLLHCIENMLMPERLESMDLMRHTGLLARLRMRSCKHPPNRATT